ncbi:myb-like protein AA isoform X2 [Amborella trichopoda]|uniref:Uncharacterized protein n=1 Tax=Amborella trichopoda TaxID=13333 RepID=W1PS32_AMBTC|nr:myb-like protein AA isoform X2 [Amborella trichopoda]ERN12822.1 hypothetical protein AMTR_s00180p00027580 [Amborella trichopoda]|eukprot:XP_006851241.1 myb-like protein AA isoform X2 [Amborella trichopoda]
MEKKGEAKRSRYTLAAARRSKASPAVKLVSVCNEGDGGRREIVLSKKRRWESQEDRVVVEYGGRGQREGDNNNSDGYETVGSEEEDDDLPPPTFGSSTSSATVAGYPWKIKLQGKAWEEANTMDRAPVPRKLRSAMNKRNRESVSPPLPTKEQNGTASLTSPTCNGGRKSSQKQKQGGSVKCSSSKIPKLSITTTKVSKAEEEVAETLYDLARMFAHRESSSPSPSPSAKPRPEPDLDSKSSHSGGLSVRDMNNAVKDMSNGAASPDPTMPPLPRHSLSTEEKKLPDQDALKEPTAKSSLSSTSKAPFTKEVSLTESHQETNNSHSAVSALDEGNKPCLVSDNSKVPYMENESEQLPHERMEKERGPGLDFSPTKEEKEELGIKDGPNHDEGKVQDQPQNSENTRDNQKPASASASEAPTGSGNKERSIDIWKLEGGATITAEPSVSLSSASKRSEPPLQPLIVPPAKLNQNPSAVTLPTEKPPLFSPQTRQSWKRCAAHVYISRLIDGYQKMENLSWAVTVGPMRVHLNQSKSFTQSKPPPLTRNNISEPSVQGNFLGEKSSSISNGSAQKKKSAAIEDLQPASIGVFGHGELPIFNGGTSQKHQQLQLQNMHSPSLAFSSSTLEPGSNVLVSASMFAGDQRAATNSSHTTTTTATAQQQQQQQQQQPQPQFLHSLVHHPTLPFFQNPHYSSHYSPHLAPHQMQPQFMEKFMESNTFYSTLGTPPQPQQQANNNSNSSTTSSSTTTTTTTNSTKKPHQHAQILFGFEGSHNQQQQMWPPPNSKWPNGVSSAVYQAFPPLQLSHHYHPSTAQQPQHLFSMESQPSKPKQLVQQQQKPSFSSSSSSTLMDLNCCPQSHFSVISTTSPNPNNPNLNNPRKNEPGFGSFLSPNSPHGYATTYQAISELGRAQGQAQIPFAHGLPPTLMVQSGGSHRQQPK